MNNIANNQFVDGVDTYLPPLWKGSEITYYPGWSYSVQTGLRRYVFRHEKNSFIYVATRQGQRNSGEALNNPSLTYNILDTVSNITFNPTFNYESASLWRQSSNSYMEYDGATQRWEWFVRPNQGNAPAPYPFVLSAYSGTTTKLLPDTSTVNQVDWFINYSTPNLPATVTIDPAFSFNNSSLAGLNSWPIKNTDESGGEGRPQCITDDLIFKLFQGIPLKVYDIVFVEVVWRKMMTAGIQNSVAGFPVGKRNLYTFIQDNEEWFTPHPVAIKNQKGLIYRIGKLEKDTGIGNFDKVTFAQRTRVLTQKTKGGPKGIANPYDTTGALTPIRS